MRVGHGYDVHRFIEGRPLILGGVEIPHDRGLEAHSDGDAVIHAICDALLGAAALGDIGTYYPDTDDKFSDIDSRILLRDVCRKLAELNFSIANIDATIVAQAPKMLPHINKMKTTLSEDMQISTTDINIKATTTERMGFIGNEEGLAVHAVCLIKPTSS
ncbi:MAG: 2-C-methyl-D-erythritol 2,4-cyclodiphosphate synthase [Gammaproteobacteria bacterium]|nr:2-C-methyl-D-erythritol 2,4-cyclodiphosphate synthase [Gammaproteobacteria bacterium]